MFWSCSNFAAMKVLTHLIIYAAALTASTVHAAEPTSYMDLVQKADDAIKDAHWHEAEEMLVEAMRTEPANPGNILLMSNLGMVRYYSGQDSLALQTLNDAHVMAPQSVTVLQNRAKVLLGMNKSVEAYDDFSTALGLDSLLTETRFYHAMLALEQGLDTVCAQDIRFMERHAAKSRYTNLAAATYHRLTGKYAEAIPYLSRLIETEKAAEHYAARAECEMKRGDLNSAAMDIAEAIALEPTDGDLYLQRAILNKMRYRPDDAQADGKRAMDLGVPAEKVRSLLR